MIMLTCEIQWRDYDLKVYESNEQIVALFSYTICCLILINILECICKEAWNVSLVFVNFNNQKSSVKKINSTQHLYFELKIFFLFVRLFVSVLWYINLCRSFNAKFIFIQKINSV